MDATLVSQESILDRYARVGLWALPIYGLANLIGTLSSQPDYKEDFPGYARYISTSPFLASHLFLSILGTGIGILGFTSLFVYLMRASSRPGIALGAFVMTVLGNVGIVSVFGVAAFAQRAIGKTYLAGHHDVVGLNSLVYGTPLWSTPLAQIASVGIEPRTLNPTRRGVLQYLYSGSLRNRLRIDVTSGTPQFFVVNSAERVVETIRHAARLDA